MRTMWLQVILAAGVLVLATGPASAGGAGCCRCTGCASPELFACRDALDMNGCDAACTGLGCSDKQFIPATNCVDVSQCFGDCCVDFAGGCSQVAQGSCGEGHQFFANSFCDASNCVAQPPTATVTATGTASATPTPSGTVTQTATGTASANATATDTATDTPTAIPSATPSATAVDTATPSPTVPSTVTPTATAVDSATPTVSPTDTPTDTASPTETPTAQPPTATPTLAPTASATASPSVTAPATASVTPTPTTPLVDTPTPTPTELTDDLTWLIDGTDRVRTLTGIPVAGVTYRSAPQLPSLSLLDAAQRFCNQSGLLPQIHLDLPPESCENQCEVGIFLAVEAGEAKIAHLPALNRAGGTFDVLIDTPLVCVPGQPPHTVRMRNGVRYTSCVGDCDSDGVVEVNEVVQGVAIALGTESLGSCPAHDRSGDGAVTIDELIAAVRNLLDGCGA